MLNTALRIGEKNMTGQLFKDITQQRIAELSEQILNRELKPLEINMFLHNHIDNLDRIYTSAKQQIDLQIMAYLKTLKDKDENTST